MVVSFYFVFFFNILFIFAR